MAKKTKNKAKLKTVPFEVVKYYKRGKVKGFGVACVGKVGNHIIDLVGGNERAAFNKVQRAFNKLGI